MDDQPGLPRGYAGDTKREPVHFPGLYPVGPWHAIASVTALPLERGTRFEVGVEWVGPPAIGFPPSDEPVHSRDCYVVDSLELARGLALRAQDAFRAPRDDEVPDLRDLVAELRR